MYSHASTYSRATFSSGHSSPSGSISYNSPTQSARSTGRGGVGNIKSASSQAQRARADSFNQVQRARADSFNQAQRARASSFNQLDSASIYGPAVGVDKAESIFGREIESKTSSPKIRSGRGGSGNAHINKPLPENTARIMARARDHEAELVAISALNATSGAPGRGGSGNHGRHLKIKNNSQHTESASLSQMERSAPSPRPEVLPDEDCALSTTPPKTRTLPRMASFSRDVLRKLRVTKKSKIAPEPESNDRSLHNVTTFSQFPNEDDGRSSIGDLIVDFPRPPAPYDEPEIGETASITRLSTTNTYASSMTVRDSEAEYFKKYDLHADDPDEPDDLDDDRSTLRFCDSDEDLPSSMAHADPYYVAFEAIPRMLNYEQPSPDSVGSPEEVKPVDAEYLQLLTLPLVPRRTQPPPPLPPSICRRRARSPPRCPPPSGSIPPVPHSPTSLQ